MTFDTSKAYDICEASNDNIFIGVYEKYCLT